MGNRKPEVPCIKGGTLLVYDCVICGQNGFGVGLLYLVIENLK